MLTDWRLSRLCGKNQTRPPVGFGKQYTDIFHHLEYMSVYPFIAKFIYMLYTIKPITINATVVIPISFSVCPSVALFESSLIILISLWIIDFLKLIHLNRLKTDSSEKNIRTKKAGNVKNITQISLFSSFWLLVKRIFLFYWAFTTCWKYYYFYHNSLIVAHLLTVTYRNSNLHFLTMKDEFWI